MSNSHDRWFTPQDHTAMQSSGLNLYKFLGCAGIQRTTLSAVIVHHYWSVVSSQAWRLRYTARLMQPSSWRHCEWQRLLIHLSSRSHPGNSCLTKRTLSAFLSLSKGKINHWKHPLSSGNMERVRKGNKYPYEPQIFSWPWRSGMERYLSKATSGWPSSGQLSLLRGTVQTSPCCLPTGKALFSTSMIDISVRQFLLAAWMLVVWIQIQVFSPQILSDTNSPLLYRYLLSSKFQQPVFLTLCHMVASSLVPLLAMATRSGPRPIPLTRSQLGRLAILSTVFCTSVVLGNVALRFLHVSFFQVSSFTTIFVSEQEIECTYNANFLQNILHKRQIHWGHQTF